MIEVTKVKHAGGYKLALEFSDGTSGVADLASTIEAKKKFASLRDEKVFRKAFVDGGTVCWPGDLDLAPERFYALAHDLPGPDTLEQARANELEMSLRELRDLAGVTQVDLAEDIGISQAELSRFENRGDVRMSTLRRYVEALGGKLEVIATLRDKRITLRT